MRHRISVLITCIIFILLMFTTSIKSATAVTWSVSEGPITTYPYYDGFPAITQTKDGKLWLVWARSTLGNLTLYYKTSRDLGTTWQEEMNLTREPAQCNDQNPSIIQAKNSTIWVFWTSDRLPASPPPPPNDFSLSASPASLSIPQGGSDQSNITVTSINGFNEPVNLKVLETPPGVSTNLNPATVTPPPNGSINSTLTVSVDASATPGSYTLEVTGRSSQRSHIVEISLEITSASGSSAQGEDTLAPKSSVSSSTQSVFDDCEIFFKVSHDNGATWSNDIQLTDNAYDDLKPSVVQLQNGTIFVAWQSYETGNHDIVYKTTQNGISWSDTKKLTTHIGSDKAPSVTQTKDSKIWVTWSTNRTGDNEIYYKTYSGLSWSGDTRLTDDSANSDLTPAIIQTIDSSIYIFWCSMPPTGGADIYYKYSSDNGDTWSGRTQFTTDNYEDMWPSATQTSDTKIRVVWVTNRADQPDGNWEIYYKTSLAGDINEDGAVDIFDLTLVGLAFGNFEGEPHYNPDADINKDGIVDIGDISIVTLYYGET